jgi:hypothetical protein
MTPLIAAAWTLVSLYVVRCLWRMVGDHRPVWRSDSDALHAAAVRRARRLPECDEVTR